MKLAVSVFTAGLLLASAAQAAPPCVDRCKRLAEDGLLRKGISQAACTLRVCQEDAHTQYSNRRFQDSLDTLLFIRTRAENSSAYNFQLGLVYYAVGKYDEAIKAFERILKFIPESVRGGAQRAHALVRLGRLPEARAQFEAILGWKAAGGVYKGLNTRSYVEGNLAIIDLHEGDIAGGKVRLDRALSIDGTNRHANTWRHRILPALEAGTVGPEVVLGLVEVFENIELGYAEKGLAGLDAMIKKYPSFKLAYLVAANTQRKGLAYDSCVKTLEEARVRFPNDVTIYAEKIRCSLLENGIRAPESVAEIEALRELAERDPKHPLIQEMLELLGEI